MTLLGGRHWRCGGMFELVDMEFWGGCHGGVGLLGALGVRG